MSRKYTRSLPNYIATIVMSGSMLASTARAEFNSAGIETFAGTTLDTATWQSPGGPLGGTISQNNQLIFSANNPSTGLVDAQYITKNITVGIGGFVQVDATLFQNSVSPMYGQHLSLIMANPGVAFEGGSNIVYLDESLSPTPEFTAWYVLPDGGGFDDLLVPNITPVPGTTYRLRIDRESAADFLFSVEQTDGTLLASVAWSVPNEPAAFYAGVFGQDSVADFNSFRIPVSDVPVPEPASLSLAVLGSAAMLMRSRRIRARVRLHRRTH
jgi:hypothetical protein